MSFKFVLQRLDDDNHERLTGNRMTVKARKRGPGSFRRGPTAVVRLDATLQSASVVAVCSRVDVPSSLNI